MHSFRIMISQINHISDMILSIQKMEKKNDRSSYKKTAQLKSRAVYCVIYLINLSQSPNKKVKRPINKETRAITVLPNEAPKPIMSAIRPQFAAYLKTPLRSIVKKK